VSLGWDIAAALPALRAQANGRMTETVTAGTFTDGVDDATGGPTRVPVGDPIYTGPARVKYTDNAVRSAEGASQLVTTQDVTVSLPHGSVVLPEGTDVLVTASTADPALVGRSYKVDGSPTLGQSTAHRYPVTELS
jgi:hypothetical protein